jgi:hypothetical protein
MANKVYGGSKPGKKHPLPIYLSTENKKAKSSTYEKERRPGRSFNQKWKDGRDWLSYNINNESESENVMKCTVCIEHARQTTSHVNLKLKHKHLFITGCSNFKLSTITDHEKSKGHLDACDVHNARKNPTDTPAHKALLTLNEKNRKELDLKFRNVHAVIKHNRPISDYMWLNELDEAKGLDHGETYNNRFSGTLFLENISRVEKDNLQKFISDINFFSLTMEKTDDSITEQESLFVRTSHKGKIITRFICIGEPDSTCSSDLYQFVIAQMKDNGIYTGMGKLVGFGSDGASNMVGVKHGLVTLIKKDYPGVVGIHCLGHRLELAFKDALKKDKTYDKLVTLMLGMYYFYRNSPAQRKKLKKTFKVSENNI